MAINIPKAILVDVIDPQTSNEDAENRLEELENLTNTYGGIVVVKMIQKRGLPDYSTYIGKGKVDEIIALGLEHEAEIVIINNILKPKQIFNLNEAFRDAKMVAWDRIDMILKIFDLHATSTLAKLQIQLASIRHMGPRIFNMGIELMQQTGAVGQRGGSGETNIEMMKRHLRDQQQNIEKKLKHYQLIDEGHRQRRRRQNFKTVALVGYTNAGKSSLMKALTGKEVYIADQLFATLDTRVGSIYIQPKGDLNDGKYHPGKEILVSDTIGFIQDLPPELIQAFKSTLAETIDADLILHVIDIADPHLEMKVNVVEEILDQLGLKDKPKIYVFNKVDLLAPSIAFEGPLPEPKKETSLHRAGRHVPHLLGWHSQTKINAALLHAEVLEKKYKQFSPIFVSAHEKSNIDKLIDLLDSKLVQGKEPSCQA